MVALVQRVRKLEKKVADRSPTRRSLDSVRGCQVSRGKLSTAADYSGISAGATADF